MFYPDFWGADCKWLRCPLLVGMRLYWLPGNLFQSDFNLLQSLSWSESFFLLHPWIGAIMYLFQITAINETVSVLD